MENNIEQELKRLATETEENLQYWLSEKYAGDTLLREAMCYSTLNGGKRIRAFLVLVTAEMFGGTAENALPFASALEMVHAYSLIHDDLPCMDNDDFRRGKPSCHKQFGEANALLAGDTLLTQAFEVLTANPHVSDRAKVCAVSALSQCAGARGMAGGQFYDLAEQCSTFEELLRLQSMKTAALIRAALWLGYYSAEQNDPAVLADLATYAEGIGIAFQITDDLLDVYSDTATLGKPVGSDAKNGKKTVLTFRTAEQAKELAVTYTENAINAVKKYPNSDTLTAFADMLLHRKK